MSTRDLNQEVALQYVQRILHQHDVPIRTHQWICLPMTERGWKEARRVTPSFSGVYIHFSSCGVPLRVGLAVGTDGIRSRWFTALSCHWFSFQQHPSAPQNYKSFFAQIQHTYPNTTLLCVSIDPQLAVLGERALMEALQPLWEVRGANGRCVWKDKMNFAQNPSITLSETESLQQMTRRAPK